MFRTKISKLALALVLSVGAYAQAVNSKTQVITSGGAASGSAVSGNPNLVAGSDGTNARTVKTDSAGVVQVNPGLGASGAPVGIIACDSNALLNMSTATTTEIVALTASQNIYICSISFMAGGTTNVKLVRGTGTNCGTGTTDLSANYPLIANTGLARGNGIGSLYKVTASNALCVTSSAAVTLAVDVSYIKF